MANHSQSRPYTTFLFHCTTDPILIFCSERGRIVPRKLIESIRTDRWGTKEDVLYCDIAQALVENDNIQLATAIDAAEAYSLVVHAARMRIVLAERIGDRCQLKRALAVLEPLQDRKFLKRLSEVEAMLDTKSSLLKQG